MKQSVKRPILWVCATLLAFVVLFLLLQALFMPKYQTASREGNLVAEYYNETREHDVLFVGDCEVYENFSPITLWEEYGITSYIRGSGQQLIWQSYYLLEEMLENETPQAVVFNVLAMEYNEPQSEAYNRMTLDGMRLSTHKLNAIRASMTEDETLVSYLLPLLRFHSRWNELTWEDVRYLFHRDAVSVSGYMLRADTKPMGTLPTKRPLTDSSFGDNAWEYLERIADLCAEQGTTLILIKAPVEYPYWYEEWDEQIRAFAEERGIPYLNLLDYTEEIGLDFQTDTYDAGLHLNVYGAEKLSRFFGEWLTERLTFPDHSEDEELCAIWAEKTAAYYAEWEQQLHDLEEYGYLKSLGQKADS